VGAGLQSLSLALSMSLSAISSTSKTTAGAPASMQSVSFPLIEPPSIPSAPSQASSALLAVPTSGWIFWMKSSQRFYCGRVSVLSARVLEMASGGIRQRLPQPSVEATVYQRAARARHRRKAVFCCLDRLGPDTACSRLLTASVRTWPLP
jgi:hypothetical protein